MIKFLNLLLAVIGSAGAAAAGGEPVLFSREIAPVLIENCLSCHSDEKAKGGYRIHTFEQLMIPGKSGEVAVQPGKAAESELYERLITHDEDDRMPQKSEPLGPAEIDLIGRWIDQGAKQDTGTPSDLLVTLVPQKNHPTPPEQYPRGVPILSLAFDPEGKTIAAGGYHEITVWDVSGRLLRRITNVAQRVHALVFDPGGNWIAMAGGKAGRSGEVSMYSATLGELQATLLRTADEMLALAVDPLGKRLAAAGTDNAIHIFDIEARKEVRSIQQHADWVTCLQFSSDGKRLASASRDRTARIYDVETGELQVSYTEHALPVNAVTFAPGEALASGGREKSVHVWKAEDGKKIRNIGGYSEPVHKVLFASDSLFSASADTVIRQHSMEGKLIRSLQGHEGAVFALAHHEPSGMLASGSYDGVVKVWKMEDGSLLHSFIAAPGSGTPAD